MKKPCTKVSSQKVMKTLPKGKGTLSKGSKGKGALSKGSKGKKALAKGFFDKSQKKKPTKKTLEQMGEVSLKERVEMATKGSATAEEACQKLRDSMTEKEKQSAWGKHQTFLKANPDEKEKNEQLSKKDKGLAATLWLLKKENPTFISVVSKVSTSQTLTKGEVWESEKTMLDRFGKDEFQIHLNSGRIRWREDQWSEGVFNYYDQGNVKKKTKVNTGSEWTQGQEYQAEEEDQEKFAKLQGKDLHKHLHDMATLPKGKGNEKGGGRGGGGNVRKRKGRGKGLLALEDGTVEEEDGKKEEEEEDDGKNKKDPWDEAKNKARKARDLCQGAASNLEESLTKAKGTNRLSKGHKKDAEDLLVQSARAIEKIKGFLVKRPSGMSLEQAKELTIHATKVTKELKDHKRELDLLSNKAMSKCSSKW